MEIAYETYESGHGTKMWITCTIQTGCNPIFTMTLSWVFWELPQIGLANKIITDWIIPWISSLSILQIFWPAGE